MRGYRTFKFSDFSKYCKWQKWSGANPICELDTKYSGCSCCPTFCIPWYREGRRAMLVEAQKQPTTNASRSHTPI